MILGQGFLQHAPPYKLRPYLPKDLDGKKRVDEPKNARTYCHCGRRPTWNFVSDSVALNSIDASRVFWINTKVCLWLDRCQVIGFYSFLIFANSWSDYVGVFRRPSGHLTYWPTYYRDKRYQDSRENRSVFR